MTDGNSKLSPNPVVRGVKKDAATPDWFLWLAAPIGAIAGAMMGALMAFVLPRYISPRRYLELLRVEKPLAGTTGDGHICSEEHFVVRYEGSQVQPLPMTQWEPNKWIDRTIWRKYGGAEKQRPGGIMGLSGDGNWRVGTLNPPTDRSGLWLYPGETLLLTVNIVFPAGLVVGEWKHRRVSGTVRFQYGLGKSLKIPHTYSPLMPQGGPQVTSDLRAVASIAIGLFSRGLGVLRSRQRTPKA